MEKTRFEQRLAEKRRENGFLYAKLIGEVSDQLNAALHKESLSRTELASKLGYSRAYVTRLLNEHPNLTIKSLIIVSNALNREVLFQLVPFEADAAKTYVEDHLNRSNYDQAGKYGSPGASLQSTNPLATNQSEQTPVVRLDSYMRSQSYGRDSTANR